MERIAFLIEETGERVFALLNPEDLTFERRSGTRPRAAGLMPLAAARRTDDPLINVGGGTTDLILNLLFDIPLFERISGHVGTPPAPGVSPVAASAKANGPTSGPQVQDVRELSGPLWQLGENIVNGETAEGPPIVHFIWGSSWLVRCCVMRVAERFDMFNENGSPQRSWMRLHLRRVAQNILPYQSPVAYTAPTSRQVGSSGLVKNRGGGTAVTRRQAVTNPATTNRPDLLATQSYGDPRRMRDVLAYNNIDNFWSIPHGTELVLPPLEDLQRSRTNG